MKPEEFLIKAKVTISDNPIDRLSKKTKAIFEKQEFVIDVHCHLFDKNTINIWYFILRFLKDQLGVRGDKDNGNFNYTIDDVYQNISKPLDATTEEEWKELEEILSSFDNKDHAKEGVRGIGSVIKNRKLLSFTNMKSVYDYYISRYALNQYGKLGLKNKDLIITALMMDLEMGWEVDIEKSIQEQIVELKKLALDVPVLPFLYTDPRRADLEGENNLYQLFLDAFSNSHGQSFFGVKIYPGFGYLPSDKRLLPIYEICEQKKIPVLTHCGGESVTTHRLEIDCFRKGKKVSIRGQKRQDVAFKLNDPKEWISVLEDFKELKLNLGHFGGDAAWENYDKNGSNQRIDTILNMMGKYPNLYGDFSYNVIDTKIYSIFKTILKNHPIAKERALFGSDFWVVCGGGNLKKRQEDFLYSLIEFKDVLTNKNPSNYLFY